MRSTPMGASAPATSADKVYKALVRLQTYLLRYGKGAGKKFKSILWESNEKIEILIIRYSRKLQGVPIRSQKFRTITNDFAKEITAVRVQAWAQVESLSVEELIEVAAAVQTATSTAIEAALPVVIGIQELPSSTLSSIVQATPFQGKLLKEWIQNNKVVDVERITRNAKIGMVRGETAEQIVKRVIGTSKLQYKDGQLMKAVRDMESVYLTVLNGIGNEVRSTFYKANADIASEELFVATLDDRTTIICAGLDGKRFAVGEGPVPPLHFRCRSLRVLAFNVENLSTRAAVPTTEKMLLAEFASQSNLGGVKSYDDLPRGFKTKYNEFRRKRLRELIGQVPVTVPFDTWLRDQSETFQNEYLGKAKADIYREGKLTLDKFVTRDGYELTIEQLKQLSKRMGAEE